MLTALRGFARRAVPVPLAFLLAVGLVMIAVAPAEAAFCAGDSSENELGFGDCDPGSPGDEDDGDGGGTSQPPCKIEPGDNACYKGESCLINDPAANSEEDVKEKLPPKPEGDGWHVAFRSCGGEYLWYWSQDAEPTPGELAQSAFNQLRTPPYTATFNPPGQTLVNLETWWWAAGPAIAPITASAGSVTATAGPKSIEVDPGDGSGVKVCPFVTAQSDVCNHVYRRSTKAGGYPARMRLVYAVSFTDEGRPLDLAGLPTQLSSAWAAVTVPVREVQILNRSNR